MIRPEGKMRTILVLGLFFCVAACVVLFMLRSNPVLVGFGADVRSHRGMQILNPFRARATENRAEAFFEVLKRPDCQTALGQIEDNLQRVVSTCSEEHKYPIVKWRIEAVGHDPGRVLLRYAVQRQGPLGRSKGPFWIWLSNKNGNWMVTGYETWY
jgi:hypothetical protein